MPSALLVAFDVVREAAHRRWMLAIAAAITLLGIVLAFTMQIQVIDGLLASTSLFGVATPQALRPADIALKPLFVTLCWTVYAFGVPFGAFACADFAPELLAPGRVEYLLSLPIRRWELLVGTYLGVTFVAFLGSGYSALIFTLLLGVKSGVWSSCIVSGSLSVCLAWSAVYGAMLASAVFVRSAALSGSVGIGLFVAGLGLTHSSVAGLFAAGTMRSIYLALIAPIPRFWTIARVGPVLAGFDVWDADLVRTLLGTIIFGAACVILAIWEFERRDY